MKITVDPKARPILLRQMQGYVEWLLSEPPGAKRTLGPANHNELVLNFLHKSRKLGDNLSHLRLLEHFGATLQHNTHLDLLNQHLTVALALPNLPNAPRVKLASLHARLLTQRGHLQRAQQVLDHAWAAANTPFLQAELYNRHAVLLEVKEKYTESQQAYLQGLALAEESGNLHQVTLIYNNLGNWAYAQERYEEAVVYYQKALEAAKLLNDPTHCARAEGGLAMTLGLMKRYETAKQYHEMAREHYKQSANLFGVIRVDLNRCYFAILQGEYSKAKLLASQARISAQRLGNLQYEGTAIHNLGRIFIQEGHYEAACEQLAQALEIRQWLGKPSYLKETVKVIQWLVEAIENDPNINSALQTKLRQQCQAMLTSKGLRQITS